MEFFFLLLGAIFAVAIAIFIIMVVYNPTNSANADNEPPPQLSQEARVIGKRQQPFSNSLGTFTIYYVAFELPDRSRIEYSVDGL
jgi:hypothetical protein